MLSAADIDQLKDRIAQAMKPEKLTDVADLAPELLPFEERLEEISEYGVAVRYPDDYYEPTIDEARHAYDTALAIQTIIVDKIQF